MLNENNDYLFYFKMKYSTKQKKTANMQYSFLRERLLKHLTFCQIIIENPKQKRLYKNYEVVENQINLLKILT